MGRYWADEAAKTRSERSRGNGNPLSLGLSGLLHHYKQPLARR